MSTLPETQTPPPGLEPVRTPSGAENQRTLSFRVTNPVFERLEALRRRTDLSDSLPGLTDTSMSGLLRRLLDEGLARAEGGLPGAGVTTAPRLARVVVDRFDRTGAEASGEWQALGDLFQDLLAAQGHPEPLAALLRQELRGADLAFLCQARTGMSRLEPVAVTFGSLRHVAPGPGEDTPETRCLDLCALAVAPAHRHALPELGLMEAIAAQLPPRTGLRATCRLVGLRPVLARLLRVEAEALPQWTPREAECLPCVEAWDALAACGGVLDLVRDAAPALDPSDLEAAERVLPGPSGAAWLWRLCGDDPVARLGLLVEGPEAELRQAALRAVVGAYTAQAWRPSQTGGAPRPLCPATHFHRRQGASAVAEVGLFLRADDPESLGTCLRVRYPARAEARAVNACDYELARGFAACRLTARRFELGAERLGPAYGALAGAAGAALRVRAMDPNERCLAGGG